MVTRFLDMPEVCFLTNDNFKLIIIDSLRYKGTVNFYVGMLQYSAIISQHLSVGL